MALIRLIGIVVREVGHDDAVGLIDGLRPDTTFQHVVLRALKDGDIGELCTIGGKVHQVGLQFLQVDIVLQESGQRDVVFGFKPEIVVGLVNEQVVVGYK